MALRKQVKQAARREKHNYDDTKFKELQGLKEGWEDLRCKRKPFVPNHSKLDDRTGRRVPYAKTAHAIADFLANEQWAEPLC